MFRHGRPRCLIEETGTAARLGDRPAMDGRAGRSEARMIRHGRPRYVIEETGLRRALMIARPWMTGPGDPKP